MLERYEVKVSRTVLRRGRASNRLLLSLRLYYLSMSFMSLAVMCIQPPINSDFDSLDKARWGKV